METSEQWKSHIAMRPCYRSKKANLQGFLRQLTDLEIDKWLHQLTLLSTPPRSPDLPYSEEPTLKAPNDANDKNDPAYKSVGPAKVIRSDRLLRSSKVPASNHISLLCLLASHPQPQVFIED